MKSQKRFVARNWNVTQTATVAMKQNGGNFKKL